MTLSEFKAWFDGYTEDLPGAPTKTQFERIKAKVAEITGTPITYPVYIDRYVHPIWPAYRDTYPYWSGGVTYSNTLALTGSVMGHMQGKTFNGHTAMYALGKAEALN